MGEKMDENKARVLVGRFTLDGHDRGVLTVLNALRNAGMEVIYIFFSSPLEIVRTAVQENADVIGITMSMGQHMLVCSMLMEELEKQHADIPVIVGGVIPTRDVPKLMGMGIKKVFGPGSKPRDAVSFISQLVRGAKS